MAEIINPARHADLIDLQVKALQAYSALDAWPKQVAKPGLEWTPEEHTRSEELREVARQASAAKDEALHASGLVTEYGYYQASQALKQAAKEQLGT